jgi:hypothetical protein
MVTLYGSVSFVIPINWNITYELSVAGSHYACLRSSLGNIWGNRRKLGKIRIT